MLQGDLDCVPIEVKAEQNLRARSLKAFCDKYKPGMAIRSSMSNYKQDDQCEYVQAQQAGSGGLPLYGGADGPAAGGVPCD